MQCQVALLLLKPKNHSNTGASDYITGSVVPSVENNTTSASPQSMVFSWANKSDFPPGYR